MTTPRFSALVCSLTVGICLASCPPTSGSDLARASTDYGTALEQFRQIIEEELQQGPLTGLSVALVDGNHVVAAEGFGWADAESQRPATRETVYRVGSISKLFTAMAVMQLVEQGKLDLDAPLSQVIPDFRIVIPFEDAPPITLRQLMCHRSGMVRESPVGGYLDDTQPAMTESIASLAACVLVNPPNSKTRYSNIGVTLVGRAVELASGEAFEHYQRRCLLEPLGMTHSSWRRDRRVQDELAQGYMRVADGTGGFTHQQAPCFELGTVPAGNLYSNAVDMAAFARMLLNGGLVESGRLITEDSLARMSTPQLTDDETGFGLGFFVGRFGRFRTIRHSGAVYGFSTSLVVVPDAGIAVVVLANEDIAPGPVQRVSDAALQLMLSAKCGEGVTEPPTSQTLDTSQLSAFAGQYESDAYWSEISVQDDRLLADISGQPMTLRCVGDDTFEAEGRFVHRETVKFARDSNMLVTGFQALGQKFSRVSDHPLPIPVAWLDYVGSYGPGFIPLVVSQRHGHLYAMTENMVDYRLKPITETVFGMPAGLYADEYLVFARDAAGQIHSATLANMQLPRRAGNGATARQSEE